MSAFHPLRTFGFGGNAGAMATDRALGRLWRGVKFILIDWTVTPRMLALNERRPFVYQLVTTPIVTLVFATVVAVAIAVLSSLGISPSR